MILSPGGPIFANKITELQSLSTFNYAVLYSKGVKNAGAVPGFFARGVQLLHYNPFPHSSRCYLFVSVLTNITSSNQY